MNITSIRQRLDALASRLKAPRPLLYAGAIFVVFLVVEIAVGVLHHPSPVPAAQVAAQAPTSVAHVIASPRPPAAVASSTRLAASGPGVAVLPQASAVAATPGLVMLPAQPAPAGLARGLVSRELDGQNGGAWTKVGSDTEPAGLASFSGAVPGALAAFAPSSGQMRTRFMFWWPVTHPGAHVLVLRLDGDAAATATIALDGAAEPTIQLHRDWADWGQHPPATATAEVALAPGVHQVEIDLVTDSQHPAATVSLYARAPGADLPAGIVPFAMPAAGGAP